MVLATREIEVGESLEPRSSRLQGGMIRPLHSSLGNRMRPYWKTNYNPTKYWLGAMAHIYNPNTLGRQGRRITCPGVQDKTGQHRKTPISIKNLKSSQALWHMPVFPATEEAEVGGWIGAGRLQWAVITPLHSTLGNRARSCQKNKIRPGTVAHACNPCTLGGQGRQIIGDQEFSTIS